MIYLLGWSGTECTINETIYCLIVPALNDRWQWWLWSNWWNGWLTRGPNTRRNPAPVPLCPPQIPLDLTRARTQPTMVGTKLMLMLICFQLNLKWKDAFPIWFEPVKFSSVCSACRSVSSAYWPCKMSGKLFWIHTCEHFISEMNSRSGCDYY
jgi:hypothetical protein